MMNISNLRLKNGRLHYLARCSSDDAQYLEPGEAFSRVR